MSEVTRKRVKAVSGRIFVPDAVQINPEEVTGIYADPVCIIKDDVISGGITAAVTGIATEAKQDTGNVSLASIEGKIPFPISGRIPVDIGGNGAITVTSGTITVANTVEVTNDIGSPIPVSGTVTANTGLAQPLTDNQLRASALPVSVASIPSHPVTNTGTFAVQVTSAPTTAVTGTFWQATQPISGTVTVANPTAVGLTDTQLRATPVPISGTVTANIGTPGTLATAANQTTIIGHVDGIEGLLGTIDADTSLLSGTISNNKVQADIISLPTVNISDNGGSVTVDGTIELGTNSLAAIEDIDNKLPILIGGRIPVNIPTPLSVSTGLTQPLTDTELRASAVVISGNVNTGLAQPLTDTQLRASSINVNTGLSPLTNTELRASAISVSTGLSQAVTDAQLRATPVPVSISNTGISQYQFLNITATTAFTALTTISANTVIIENTGTEDIEVRKVSTVPVIKITAGFGREFKVIANSNELEIRSVANTSALQIEVRL